MSSRQPAMRDYKHTTPTATKISGDKLPSTARFRWLIAGIVLPITILSLVLLIKSPTPVNDAGPAKAEAIAAKSQEPSPNRVSRKAVSLPNKAGTTNNLTETKSGTSKPSTPAATQIEDNGTKLVLKVRSGDNLDQLFRRNNLSINDLHKITGLSLAKQYLRVIRPGDSIEVWHKGETIVALHREIDLYESLAVTRVNDAFIAETYKNAIETRIVEKAGTIKDSLFLSASDTGIPNNVIMNMTGMFAWDVDFILDVRRGDQFVVVYEELWRDGEYIKNGKILAAEFVTQNKSHRAFLYAGPNGKESYYTADGHSVRKAFLRAPLAFSRVSSNFNPNRRHPVLNTLRAHKGVDYAAARGTPIKAAGDGKVIFRGTKGGYGNTIILSHGGNISTLYAHMQKFDKKAKNGSRVTQGQVIGYVGTSGLSTGPHLHYEYRKNGTHQNPRTVKLPQAEPLDPAFKADFDRNIADLTLRLNSQRQLLASLSEKTEQLQ
ncbi:MAG: peptidoglycan DD-metalloendopeptidase family protein [Gammaproteobacteria bacterium]|nr:peptidoglycan DD-metalloendopeptidase family protein [Gammaproteobacteria bacterium]